MFLLGITVAPRDIEENAYGAKTFFGEKKVHCVGYANEEYQRILPNQQEKRTQSLDPRKG